MVVTLLLIDSKYEFTDSKEYDILCEYVLKYVQEYLVQKFKLVETWVPRASDNDEKNGKNNTFFSCTKNLLEYSGSVLK